MILQKAKTTSEEDSSISSSASEGAAPSSLVPVYEESVEVSDVMLRASDLARALKSTERSAEEYGERMEAQKVEIRIEAQIRVAGGEEKARDRATTRRRRRRAETKRTERYETAWIKRERTEAECSSRMRLRRRRRRKPLPLSLPTEERRGRNYDNGTSLRDGWRRRRPT